MGPIARAIRGAARAALLAASGWMSPGDALAATLPVDVELTLQPAIGIYSSGAPLSVSGSGTAVVNGSGTGGRLTSLALPASLVATVGLTAPVTDPSAYPVNGIQLTVANAAATVATNGGGAIGGALPIPGRFRLCLYGPCDAAVANLDIPLSPVGVGGTATAQAGAVSLTVRGVPWTSGTARVGGFGYFETITGFAHGPASGVSSTAQPGGTLQLVTPIAVSTNLGADDLIFAFGILTVHFVPEPAASAALLLGAASVLSIGKARARLRARR